MAQLEGTLRSFAAAQDFVWSEETDRKLDEPSDLWVSPAEFQVVPDQAPPAGRVLSLAGAITVAGRSSEADARHELVRLARDMGANALLGLKLSPGKDGFSGQGYPAIVMTHHTTTDLTRASDSQRQCDEMIAGLHQRYAAWRGGFRIERILRAVFWGLFGALVITLGNLLLG